MFPPVVTTVTWTMPGVPTGGAVAVISVEEMTPKLVAAVVPKSMLVVVDR